MSHMQERRHATPDSFAICRQALSKLHSLGIKHRNVSKHKFLVHAGQATIIDFANALQPAEKWAVYRNSYRIRQAEEAE